MTGTEGEKWPIPAAKFKETYKEKIDMDLLSILVFFSILITGLMILGLSFTFTSFMILLVYFAYVFYGNYFKSKHFASKKKIIVYALKMKSPFQVKVSWSEDLIKGEKGDYLVQYGENDYGVVGNDIFHKTYQI